MIIMITQLIVRISLPAAANPRGRGLRGGPHTRGPDYVNSSYSYWFKLY